MTTPARAAASERYLALDLGAESGRGMVGAWDGDRLTLEEIHRFANTPVRLGDTLHWNLPHLMHEIRQSIRQAASGGPLKSLGVDTWGVDFGLIGAGGELVGLPVHYRDRRTDGMMDKVFARVPAREVFERTGIQTMPINTLYQLAALHAQSPRLLDAAQTLLFMPDLLHYYLTGRAESEYTIASTSQMYDSRAGDWAVGMLDAAGLPTHLLPRVLPAGSDYGPLISREAEATGAAGVQVVAPGGHDTACAIAAVPAQGPTGWAYLSSGTWSLLGVEVAAPIINEATHAANITNEGGAAGTIRLLKNIAGLWLVQECRRAWARLGSERDYNQLTRLASEAAPLAAVVDPDHPSLLAPDDMPRALRELCLATGQTPPEGVGATVRCALDSLALKYRLLLATLETITGTPIHTLHIVGGGSQNRLLNQLAADATGRVVIAGPVEATAIGNVLLQARTGGRLASLDDVRAVVRASFPVETYTPDPALRGAWADAAARFTASATVLSLE